MQAELYIAEYIKLVIYAYYLCIIIIVKYYITLLCLGAFAKLRKATISFVIPVCLSVRP